MPSFAEVAELIRDLEGVISEDARLQISRKFVTLLQVGLRDRQLDQEKISQAGRKFLTDVGVRESRLITENGHKIPLTEFCLDWTTNNVYTSPGSGRDRHITPAMNDLRVAMLRDLKQRIENYAPDVE